MNAGERAASATRGDGESERAPLAFYCVCDERYFLGAVAMINSLRFHGHDAPIYLLDLGLASDQRELLAGEVTLVSSPQPVEPWLAKTIAPLRHPAETMVLIDTDMIVVRPLDELLEEAASGRVVAFRDNLERYVAGWGELPGLGPVAADPYLSSGFIATAREPGSEVLTLMDQLCREVEFERTFWRENEPDYPLLFADQDVFNAIVHSGERAQRVTALDPRLQAATPFGGPRLIDEATLACAYADGTAPYVVHYILAAKPWLERAHYGLYSRLMTRMLSDPDLCLRVPASSIPMRLREGGLAELERARIEARDRAGWLVRKRLPAPLRERLDRSRERRARR